MLTNEHIAEVAHNVNIAYCKSIGDDSVPSWSDAPEDMRASTIAGVQLHRENPDTTPEQSHEAWLTRKLVEGWKYGDVKDAEKKEHPCVVPYSELPEKHRVKDELFVAVVRTLLGQFKQLTAGAPLHQRILELLPMAQSPAAEKNLRNAANHLKELGQ